MNPEYKEVYGTWKVTTEGDCEGKTVTQLGTYTGFVDEIAKALADRAFYKLSFERLQPSEIRVIESVAVDFSIKSKTWDLTAKERATIMKEVFKGRPVRVEESNYFASFKLIFPKE